MYLYFPKSSVFSDVFSQKLLQAIKILIELNPLLTRAIGVIFLLLV